jgi:uncharacterized protein YheU (UPF0270 family)
MIIPYERLSPDALQGLLEEYATRDGTDYGEVEVALPERVAQAMGQLRRGDIVIVFDALSESVSLLGRREAQQLEHQQTQAARYPDDEASWPPADGSGGDEY